MRDDIFTPKYKTNIIPLRWISDKVSHNISMFFFHLGLKVYGKHEDKFDRYDWYKPPVIDRLKMKIYFGLYRVFGYLYSKFGTTYKMNIDLVAQLKADMDDGLGWDDYDSNGIPYWDYFWHEDPLTGDAWRYALKGENND